MRQVFIRTFFLGLFLLPLAPQAQAAALYIDPPRSELFRGDAIELTVRLDVDEAVRECVNAVDAVITYSENIVPVDVSIGDSIFSMWVERPTINQEERTITFAGGMPNGYCGRVAGDPRLTNTLVKLIFRAPGFTIGGSNSDSTEGFVSFTEPTTAYLNDGFGTSVIPQMYGATMQVNRTAGSGIVDPWRESVTADTVPPEKFSILLRKGDLEFSGRYYISFNTTDKQTGIDTYQVMEEPIEQFGSFNWGRADAPWITARSPYVLDDQTLNSVIRVRAIDKAGNEYISTLLPDETLRSTSKDQWMTYAVFSFIALIILGCLGVIAMFVRQYRRKKNKSTRDTENLETNTDEVDDLSHNE